MMALIATAGSSTANSYTTLDYALDYFTLERVGGETYLDYSPDEQAAALIQATRELERKHYKGARTTSTQALSFPRYGIPKRDSGQYAQDLYATGNAYYDSDTVPDDVQRACAELAYFHLQNRANSEAMGGLELSAFKTLKLGDDSFTLREGQADLMPKEVSALLRDFLLTAQAGTLRG